VVGPGLASAAAARHRSLRDHGALGRRVLTRPADRSLAPFTHSLARERRRSRRSARAAAESTPARLHAELDLGRC
jgi:hypothetical protein